MALKIADKFVVSFHRTELHKKLRPGEKERLQQARPDLAPLARKKPLVEFRRLNPYNRYLTIDAVNQAIGKLPQAANLAELVQQIQQRAIAHWAAKGAPGLVVVSESHGDQAALAAQLALLREYGYAAGTKRLMHEGRPVEVARLVQNQRDRKAFRAWLDANQPMPPSKHSKQIASIQLSGLYATHLGFEVGGFDTLHVTAPNRDARETAMLASIGAALADGDFTIVVTGQNHAPELHRRISPLFNPLYVSVMTPIQEGGDTESVKRASYLLSQEDILKVRPGPAFDAGNGFIPDPAGLLPPRLDVVNFINNVRGPTRPLPDPQ